MSVPADDPDLALVRALAARRWGADAAFEMQHIGQGSNNTIWRAIGLEDIAIKLSRPHREASALGEYRKEAWCAARAHEVGVRTPQVLDAGTQEGRAFAVLAFVEGAAPPQEPAIWRELGNMARCIHGIATKGWGGRMHAAGCFEESWRAHLDYNIASLTDDDALIAREVFDASGARRLLGALNRIRGTDFRFGLCHGDIALWNVLAGRDGAPWLLDWGCAVAHIVPHYEINEILRTARPAAAQWDAFLEGYGISPAAYAAMGPDLKALSAMREVDTLRWAIDKSPGDIAVQTARARAAVANLV